MSLENEDGYELWLRYRPIEDAGRLAQYRHVIASAVVLGTTGTVEIIQRELVRALPVLLDCTIPILDRPQGAALVAGTLEALAAAGVRVSPEEFGAEGYLLRSQSDSLIITGYSPSAVLTGVFHFLRLLQTHQDIRSLNVLSRPRVRHRILAHWDNLDGSVERGYAGRSLWNWDQLPAKVETRYHDYARACASLGLNGTCLNNVNANPESLAPTYLQKAAALADVFRPYGLHVYLSPSFSAPMRLGGLATSDPRDPAVARWWKQKVNEIYRLMPDFGGFQVKAHSEGQPGPQDSGASHADGANMLADALASHGGIVLWRAFVYDTSVEPDRAKCAHKEFVPLDGQFRPNVAVQVKNGAIDFQPREPFHPLFGAMPRTPLALELQVTQEYLGQARHLVYLGGMWKEILNADTHAKGAGSTVARVVDGSLDGQALTCIIGVANTGTDLNWCGHHFSQANWYAFGRLAWDYNLGAEDIADEWVRLTWSHDASVVEAFKSIMLGSWEACINYMTPLGLHHLMQAGHHYGPDPGYAGAQRPDWNNVYYHRADEEGLGFDRSHRGSDAVSQYHPPLCEQFNNLDTCPEKYLLWFHHVPWAHRLQSGQTLWEELQRRYAAGIAFVESLREVWQSLQAHVDPERHAQVEQRLEHQLENARLWREICLEYFAQFSRKPL
jgi:alpha-glucuronidase